MDAIVIFFSIGLFTYWLNRCFLLLDEYRGKIDSTLDADAAFLHRVTGAFAVR
ncbi:MAG: hypothetical protein IPM24_01795 [Bryobacterales bacterium]|jgi:hypothetical protein|nr:hypothetical protein [Bryobacterales bacterium]